MTPWWWALAAASLVALGAILSALVTRRNGSEANINTGFASLTAAMSTDMQRLRDDVAGLRVDVEGLKRDLTTEQTARKTLGEVLKSAWSHILSLGEQVRALNGEPLPPPVELAEWMSEQGDGLVVDRVKTTISRTTITDTRTPDNTLEDVEVVEIS